MQRRQFNSDQAIVNTMNQFKPQAVSSIDLAGALENYNDAYNKAQDRQKQQDLADALIGGDEKQINSAMAAYDPKLAASYLLQSKRLDADSVNNDLDRQIKQAQLANLLNPVSKPTDKIQNYEYFSKIFGPDKAALMVSPGSEAIGGALVNSSGFGNWGKAGQKEADKIFAKDYANNEISLRNNEIGIENLRNTYRQTVENLQKAQLGYGKSVLAGAFDRRIPTEMLTPEAQRSRQWLQSGAFSQTLDQAEKLSGPKSDNDIKFLKGIVAGDISEYTPAQIEGAWQRIIKNAEDEIKKQRAISDLYRKTGSSSEQNVIDFNDL